MNKMAIVAVCTALGCLPVAVNKKDVIPQHRTQIEIRQTITDESQIIENIYEKELKQKPGISGKLNIQFIVKPNGNVKDILSTLCTLSDTSFVNEILRCVSTWQFNAIRDSTYVAVDYPFIFDGKKIIQSNK